MHSIDIIIISAQQAQSYSIYKNIQLSWRKQTSQYGSTQYEGWNFNSGNYLFTTDTK